MDIGTRLKKLRIEKDYTLEYVGKIVGTTKQTLYKYENGIVTNIPSNKIKALARVYGTTPAYIMGWEKDTPITAKEKRLAEKYLLLKNSQDPKDRAIAGVVDKLLGLDE